MEPKRKTFINVALIVSLILILVDLVGKFANLTFTSWFKWLPAIILIVALIISCISFGKENNGNVTFGNVFGYGFKVSAVITGIMLIYTIIALFFIFPEIERAGPGRGAKTNGSERHFITEQYRCSVIDDEKIVYPLCYYRSRYRYFAYRRHWLPAGCCIYKEIPGSKQLLIQFPRSVIRVPVYFLHLSISSCISAGSSLTNNLSSLVAG